MQVRERLINQYPEVYIEYDPDYPFNGGGFYERYSDYPNGYITITDKLDYYLQNSILAEEFGHHETTVGNILHYYSKEYNVNAARQELRARRFGHKLILPLECLIDCYEKGMWGDVYAMCLHMEIDRSYLKEAIRDYTDRFGLYIYYSGYYIQFEPLKIKRIQSADAGDGEKK